MRGYVRIFSPLLRTSQQRALRQTLRTRTRTPFATMVTVSNALELASLPNTCQYIAKSTRGDYLVQIAWPLSWGEDRKPPPENDAPASVFYLVDGNAYFFTAVDISRRIDFTNNSKTIVVAIGYPPPYPYIYDLLRRGPDLTPPSKDGHYEPLLNSKGEPLSHLTWGEADQLLDFVENDIMTYVEGTLFSHLPLKRRALYGHSYGGLFSLNAMYTKPALFDTIIAASPTVWWNNFSLVKYQEKLFREGKPPTKDGNKPSLILTWGSSEGEFPAKEGCRDAFHRGNCDPEEKEMEGSMAELIVRMKDCGRLKRLWSWKLDGEEHGTMAVAGLQRGLFQFLLG